MVRIIVMILVILLVVSSTTDIEPPEIPCSYWLNPNKDPNMQRLLDVIAGRIEVVGTKGMIRKIPSFGGNDDD